MGGAHPGILAFHSVLPVLLSSEAKVLLEQVLDRLAMDADAELCALDERGLFAGEIGRSEVGRVGRFAQSLLRRGAVGVSEVLEEDVDSVP